MEGRTLANNGQAHVGLALAVLVVLAVLIVLPMLGANKRHPQPMADELWDQLQRALYRNRLSYKDLPETEVLLFGALEDLGFNGYIDRMKVKNAAPRNATRRRQSASL